jgi:thiopeptide-type bacteriocin biosynthesis protein
VHSFLTARAEDQMRDGAPLSRFGQWASAYAGTGRALAGLAAEGLLRRGLRDILAHHVIFAWNRLGLSYPAQSALAAAASTVVFGPDPRMAAAG